LSPLLGPRQSESR